MNVRAQRLNEMVHELRNIQQWVTARHEKLERLEGVWRTATSVQGTLSADVVSAIDISVGDRSSVKPDHLKLMRRIISDLDGDISLLSTSAPESPPAQVLPVYPPTLSISPDRVNHNKHSDRVRDDSIQFVQPSLARDSSRSSYKTADKNTSTLRQSTSSFSFASRLGASSVDGNPTILGGVQGYSDSLRSSLKAYDHHVE